MQSFKALRSIHAQFAQADLDGNGLISKPELLVVLTGQMGAEEAGNQLDKVFRQIDQDRSGDISLRELAVWYFGMEAKQRARHTLAKLQKRKAVEKAARFRINALTHV
jgi:Ca2+-binding EF-hand superfamily protein